MAGCSRPTTPTDPNATPPSPSAESAAPPSSDAGPTPTAAPAPGRPDLTWDKSVGWEPRPVFPPGVTSIERREGIDYLNLDYFAWDDPEQHRVMIDAVLLHPQRDFSTTSIIIPAERLCAPTLARALAGLSTPQLLVRVEDDPTDAQWDCLQGLGTGDLYLGLCPNVLPRFWRCDGDAQLDALAARPRLRERVVGLGVGFARAEHWDTLTTFPRLRALAVRGPGVREGPSPTVAAALCALPDLTHVDFLDAGQPGSNPQLPAACALGLYEYNAWQLLDGDAQWGLAGTPPADSVPCRLRHSMLWSATDIEREVLRRCPELTLELVDP